MSTYRPGKGSSPLAGGFEAGGEAGSAALEPVGGIAEAGSEEAVEDAEGEESALSGALLSGREESAESLLSLTPPEAAEELSPNIPPSAPIPLSIIP